MITILGGHPHAVSLAAPLLMHKSLLELYMVLTSQEQKTSVVKSAGLINNSMASLRLSLEASLHEVKRRRHLSHKFFLFVGLCPGGIRHKEIDEIWEGEWEQHAYTLLSKSLLIKTRPDNEKTSENVFSVLPFMNMYAEEQIESEERSLYNRKLCTYYGNVMKELFKEVDKKGRSKEHDEKESEIMEKIVSFETNVWACIYRTALVVKESRNTELRRERRSEFRRYLSTSMDHGSPKEQEDFEEHTYLRRRSINTRTKNSNVFMKLRTLGPSK